jgi:RNA polymerase-binding transcription factor DksA
MNQNIPAGLREQLEQQKAELTRRVDKIKADIAGGLEADSKEQAGQLENKDVLDALAIEATHEIAEINASLRRLEGGHYGVCAKCGASIDARRLKALPHAVECISCAD